MFCRNQYSSARLGITSLLGEILRHYTTGCFYKMLNNHETLKTLQKTLQY